MPIQRVETARQNYQRHAWAQEIVALWRQDVEYALKQDRNFFDHLIPELTPWPEYGQNCPACVGVQSAMGETGLYEWSIEKPDELTCTYCGTTYPHVDYPEMGSISAPKMSQTFTYYLNEKERAHPEDTTGTHAYRWVTFPVHTSFTGVLRSKRGRWCTDRVLPLARLYALTGDIACAERAVWILDIMAARYPHWLFHSYDGTYADAPPAEVAAEIGRNPRGGRFAAETIISAFEGRHQDGEYAELFNGFWGAGRFGCSGGDASMLLDMTMAYELICDAKDEQGEKLISADMDRRIVQDLILAGCDDMECWNEINNKCPPGRALSALVGRLFNRPESVRRAIDGFDALLKKGFYSDGFCTESPSYSDMFLNLMRKIPDLLAGYSDPEGYVPDAGERLVDFDPYQIFDRYRLALESMIRMLDPNLKYPVIGDTHYGSGLQPIHAEVLTAHYGKHYAGLLEQTLGAPLTEVGDEYALWFRDPDVQVDTPTGLPLSSEWFPDWHVGVLRGGRKNSDTAFYFNAYAQDNHRHTDTLGIAYIAEGQELASDRGYIWDDPRGVWTKGTFSHQIISVDGQKQNHGDRCSALELFGRGHHVEVVQATAQAYEQCDLYQRTCALINRPDGGTYVVDFFRVHGGETHHYGFHCNGELVDVRDANFAPLDKEATAPEEWLKWVEDPREAVVKGPVIATWQHEDVQMDLHILNDVDRLLLADTPGWRSCHGSQLNAPPVQQILAERNAAGLLSSQYIALMVPYKDDQSPMRSARVLSCEDGVVAIEVSLDKRTDYILSAPDYKERHCGPVMLAGRFAFLSVDLDGQPLSAYLLDGTHLAYGDMEWTLPQAHSALSVASVENKTLHLSESLSSELQQHTSVVLLGETGYDVEEITDKTIVVRDYPLVESTEAVLLHELNWSS